MSISLSTFCYELSLLKIPVTNIGRSAAFYSKVLGFREEFVAEEYGWAQLSCGAFPLALYVPGMGGGDALVGVSVGFHLSLKAPQFEMLAEHLQSEGALAEDRIHRGNDGTTFAEVRDPDGNLLKIMKVE